MEGNLIERLHKASKFALMSAARGTVKEAALEISRLQCELAVAKKTIEAQLENLTNANAHNSLLTKLVRALRDVNATLDTKLSSHGVPGVEVMEGDGDSVTEIKESAR